MPATGFRLPAYTAPNAMLDVRPITSALDSWQEADRARATYGLQQERLGMEREQRDEGKRQREIARLAGRAKVIDSLTDEGQRQQMWQRLHAADPRISEAMRQSGVDPADHINGPRFLLAEAGQYDPQADRLREAQIAAQRANVNQSNAHAEYYRGRANLDQRERWKLDPARNVMVNSITGETRPIYNGTQQPGAQAAPDFSRYGVNERGEMVPPGGPQQPQPFRAPDYVPRGTALPAPVPGTSVVPPDRPTELPGMMRLGAPREAIDGEILPPLPRQRPDGVQVAQATPPNSRGLTVPSDLPSPLQQARERLFGPAGGVAVDVPGIVTSKGRTDVPATREAAGQRAFETMMQGATPEDRARAQQFQLQQDYWTSMHRKPAPSGHYYDSRGVARPSTEPRGTAVNERQLTELAGSNFDMIDKAHDVLKSNNWLQRSLGGNPTPEGFGGFVTGALRSAVGAGDLSHAFSQFKQIAMQPAYILSGKAVAVAEMKNFIDAYAPRPNDTAREIELKVQDVKRFYNVLLAARRNKGDDLEVGDVIAARNALAREQIESRQREEQRRFDNRTVPPTRDRRSGTESPPAAPQGGVQGMSTDELIRRAFGG